MWRRDDTEGVKTCLYNFIWWMHLWVECTCEWNVPTNGQMNDEHIDGRNLGIPCGVRLLPGVRVPSKTCFHPSKQLRPISSTFVTKWRWQNNNKQCTQHLFPQYAHRKGETCANGQYMPLTTKQPNLNPAPRAHTHTHNEEKEMHWHVPQSTNNHGSAIKKTAMA